MYLAPDSNNRPDGEVAEVQRMLNCVRSNFHHSWDYLKEDGIYGKQSAKVVRQFQIYKGISSQMSADGPILGDTTVRSLKEYYQKIPVITSSPRPGVSVNKKETRFGEVAKASFDLMAFLSGEGMPIYKAIQEAFPIAFKKLSAKSDAPNFVFSKNDAYHKFGARYARINLPENVSRYLGNTTLIWSWLTLHSEVEEYMSAVKRNGVFTSATVKMGASAYTLCTSTVDSLLSSAAFKTIATRVAGRYAVAELGSAVSLSGAAALSTIGQIIGAFMLGWTIGDLMGRIPVGNGMCLQDLVDKFINYAWEHPYKALGLSPIAVVIDAWKRIIDAKVNMVSSLKPLTPAEKRKVEEYAMQHREMQMYAAPPKLIIKSR